MATKIKNVNFFILFSFLFTININAQYNQKTGTQYIATIIGNGKRFTNWDEFINYLKEIPQELDNLRRDVAQIDGLRGEITRLQNETATIQGNLDTANQRAEKAEANLRTVQEEERHAQIGEGIENQAEIDRLNEQIIQLTEDLEGARREKNEAITRITIVETKLAREKEAKELADLNKELEKNRIRTEQERERVDLKFLKEKNIQKLKYLAHFESMLSYCIGILSKNPNYETIDIETITTEKLMDEGFLINFIRKLRGTETSAQETTEIKTETRTIPTNLKPLEELRNQLSLQRFILFSQIEKEQIGHETTAESHTAMIFYKNTGIRVEEEGVFEYITLNLEKDITNIFDIQGATIQKLIIKGNNKNFTQEAYLGYLNTKGIQIENATFKSIFNINNTLIKGNFNIKKCIFKNKARFENIKTTDNINFENLTFENKVSFYGSKFNPGTTLNKTVTFKNIKFQQLVNFNFVKFKETKRSVIGNRTVNFKLETVKFNNDYTKEGIVLPKNGKITIKNTTTKENQILAVF